MDGPGMRCRAWPMIGLIGKRSMTSQISRPLARQTERLSRGEKNNNNNKWKCAEHKVPPHKKDKNRWSLEDVEGVEVLAVALEISQVKDVSISTDPDSPGGPGCNSGLSISPAALVPGSTWPCASLPALQMYLQVPGVWDFPLFSWDVATIYAFSLTPRCIYMDIQRG